MVFRQEMFKWYVILGVSAVILILRVVDFIFEAVHSNFHITRIGLNIIGIDAFIVQVCIIFISAFFLWVASDRIFSSDSAYSIKQRHNFF